MGYGTLPKDGCTRASFARRAKARRSIRQVGRRDSKTHRIRRRTNGAAVKNPSRGYRAGRSRRSFLTGAGALGLTLAAARGARGTSASVVVINENGTVSTGTNPAAAQW